MDKLNLKKRLIMYPYQEQVVTDIINRINIGKPYVLGSCPSSGKTEMAIETIIRLIELRLVNRVLVLAHSTNVLKENFYNRLSQYFNKGDIAIMKGQRNYNYDALIQVMIPQNIGHIRGQFDLVITDEAHHNVLAVDGQYSQIVKKVQPKFELLLTGTPSKFIRENDIDESLPYHINVLGMDMVGFDRFHDVKFDLIKSAYTFRNEDYSENTHNLLDDTKFLYKETEHTINNVIRGVVINIASRNGITLPKNSDFNKEGEILIREGKFGKTLIMCKSIEQANQVSKIISKSFNIDVKVSQSKNDIESNNLHKFKKGEFEFLCVVNRAREGYDDKKVVNLIDLTLTHNIDLIYQMFCRVVRLDTDYDGTKLYIKVTSNAELMPEYTMNIMTAALMLGATDNLSRFNGNNFRGIVAPRIERVETDGEEDSPVVEIDIVGDIEPNMENRVITRQRMNNLLVMDLVEMFVPDIKMLFEGNERYAVTTLGESLNILSGKAFWRDKGGYFKLCVDNNITNSKEWGRYYKYIDNPDNNYLMHSHPWRLFNQTVKEFFDECYPNKKEYWCDKEGYYYLIIKQSITHSTWMDNYKKLICPDDNFIIPSSPWKLFNQTGKEFFDECYSRKYFWEDKEGYFKLCRKYDITSTNWGEKYKSLVCPNINLTLPSEPWKLFNQTAKEFFDECYSRKQFWGDKDGYFKLCMDNNLTGQKGWVSKYKNLVCPNINLTLPSAPWNLFNQTAKEFFDEYIEWLIDNPKQEREYKPGFVGEFSTMNKDWSTSNSKKINNKLNLDRSDWDRYHKLYREARSKWEEIPYIEISKKIKPKMVVADFGCGENLLSKEIPNNKVHSFDHVSIDKSVTACDISNTPLENDSMDVVVFSLSLMGSNYRDYLKEAYRVLKPYGMLFICEPLSKGERNEDKLNEELTEIGFNCLQGVVKTNMFMYIDAIKY